MDLHSLLWPVCGCLPTADGIVKPARSRARLGYFLASGIISSCIYADYNHLVALSMIHDTATPNSSNFLEVRLPRVAGLEYLVQALAMNRVRYCISRLQVLRRLLEVEENEEGIDSVLNPARSALKTMWKLLLTNLAHNYKL